MGKRIYVGRELVEDGWFSADELLTGIREGKLSPFCNISNEKIVDVDTLPKGMLSLEEIENEERQAVYLRSRSEQEIKKTAAKHFQHQEERPIVPPGVKPYRFTHYTVLEFSFASTDIKSYSEELQAKSASEVDGQFPKLKGEREKTTSVNFFPRGSNTIFPASPSESTKPSGQADAKVDTFVRGLQVEYSSDKSIFITLPGERPREFSCDQMGFKSTAQTWAMLVGILQMDDPQYHVGVYPRDKHPDKLKKYNSATQMINEFNKKFAAFLNAEYSVLPPDKFKVLVNQKGLDRDGTYRPIFQVVRPAAESKKDIKGLSKTQYEKEIKILVERRRREKDPDKEAKLLTQIGTYIELGCKEGWLTRTQAGRYLDSNDEDCSPEDALDHAEPLSDNI